MRLLLVLFFVAYAKGVLATYNTLIPGSIIDGKVVSISEYHGYFWDDPNMGGTNFQQAGRINGGSTMIPYFTNNAGKSVVELFGRPQNIDRFCVSQYYFRSIGKSTDDWTFQFNAVIMFQGFQEFDLVFYGDVENEHIVTFEHRAISSAIRLGMLNRFSWDRHEFENPSGFDSLVSKIINHQRINFYLEFKNLHITVPTTLVPVPETTTVHETTSVTTTVPETTTVLETTSVTTTVPETTSVTTTVPETTSVTTTVPETTSVTTTVPETTSVTTTVPETTSVTTTVPETTSVTTTFPHTTVSKTSVVGETKTFVPVDTPSPNNLDMSLDVQVEDGFIPMDMDWVLYIFLPVAITFMLLIAYIVRRRQRVGQSVNVEQELEIV